MGEKLLALFKQAEEKAGIQGKIRIVLITKTSGDLLGEIPDDPEIVERCIELVNSL